MMSKILPFALFLFTSVCVAEGYYLHLQKTGVQSPEQELQARQDRWVAEIENLKRSLSPHEQEERESLLGEAFEEWFQARVAAAGVRTEVKITDKEVIASFKIRGLKSESLKISVNDVLIRASYDATTFVEKKNAHGSYRGEAIRQFQTVMPVPWSADAAKHRVVREAEGFKIIFERREDPALKS